MEEEKYTQSHFLLGFDVEEEKYTCIQSDLGGLREQERERQAKNGLKPGLPRSPATGLVRIGYF